MGKTIAILGGGNGAHAAAGDLSLKGFKVRMYEDPSFKDNMKTVFENKEIKMNGACGDGIAKLDLVTTDLGEAIEGVDTILLAVPAFAHMDYAKKLVDYIKPGQTIFILPGTFGSLILWNEFKKAGKENGVVIAETNTLPYATRLLGPGESLVMSRFNPLKVGVIPAEKTDETIEKLSEYFDGLEAVKSIIACGLSSLNPVIHVPGCILNAGRIEYAKGDFYFYTEGFTDVVVRATLEIDDERRAILNKFGYESDIVARGIGGEVISDNLSEVISGNENFAKIKGPDSTKNRYYSEDIPFGIATWAKIAKHIDVETKMMDSMVTIGSSILEYDAWAKGPSLDNLGIANKSLDEIKTYLIKG